MLIIKKYGNRRLYDTERSRYINLDELAELIRNGQDIEVQDARTSEDLTREVLLQVVMEGLHGVDLFSVGMLHRIIRASGNAPWQQMIYQQLSSGLAMVGSQMDQAERVFRMGSSFMPGFGNLGPLGDDAARRPTPPPPRASEPAAPPRAADPPPPEPAPPVAPPDEPLPPPRADAEMEALKARLAALERLLTR